MKFSFSSHLQDALQCHSAVQSARINAVAVLLSRKPLADAFLTEQDVNLQIGAALCLASTFDVALDLEPAKLGKLLPKFEKLLKCESFKAKPVLLTLVGSVIEVGGVSGEGRLRNLVPCSVSFLSNKDWAVRKATTKALGKLAVVERDLLSEFKAGCLKTFENWRFDKILEAWKQILDVSGDISPPPQSQASSKAIAYILLFKKSTKDLSLIRNQLIQIEQQHSSLLDLLQRFIGSSQNGIRSLETRVHGLELALDEISYDLAVTSGRMTKTDSSSTTCCLLPGIDFLSSKFWRKTEGRYIAPRISTASSGTPSVPAMRYRDDSNGNVERLKLNRRCWLNHCKPSCIDSERL
ncbi:hypothetical protein UlMin_007562 [Ulmus minor]